MKSKIIILTASNCLTKKNDSKPIVILSEAKRSRRIQRAELTTKNLNTQIKLSLEKSNLKAGAEKRKTF